MFTLPLLPISSPPSGNTEVVLMGSGRSGWGTPEWIRTIWDVLRCSFLETRWFCFAALVSLIR